jgi:hypothetical protein
MADRLHVDLDGLEDFAGRLRSIRDRMNATRDMVDAYEGDLGSGEVAEALHDFEHNWKDGREKIDGHLDGLAQMADQVVSEIRRADRELADGLADSTKRQRPA